MTEIITNDNYAREHFKYLFKRINKANPEREDVKALEEFLGNHPNIIRDTYHMPTRVLEEFLEFRYKVESKRTVVKAQLEDMKIQFGYEQVSLIKRMLFDSILISWVRWNYLEGCYNQFVEKGSTYEDLAFWDQRVSAAYLRFTRAIDTLGRLKKFNVNF